MNSYRLPSPRSSLFDESDRLISFADVLDRVCMSKTSLYRLINAGEFLKPIPIGRHRVGFLESEVVGWIKEKARSRDDGAEARRERARRAVKGRRRK